MDGIRLNGGVEMLDGLFPIWAVVLVKFVLAFTLEMTFGQSAVFPLGQPGVLHPTYCAHGLQTVVPHCSVKHALTESKPFV